MTVYDEVFFNLISKEIVPIIDFSITPELLTAFLSEYNLVTDTEGILKRKEAKYCIKLAALSYLKYKRSLRYELTEGFTYIISNKAWPNWYKLGMSSFPKERLRAFQTYSPLRDYKLHHWAFWFDKRKGESFIHSLYEMEYEWANIQESNLLDIYEQIHKLSGIEKILNNIYC